MGAPLIGKGVGIVGKTIMRHGNETLKKEFLPKILNAEIEFAIGYTEPDAGSDLASLQTKATKVEGGWRIKGQKRFTTSAHFADWYWVGARTDPDKPKHDGISLFLIPMKHPGLEVQTMPTIGKDITNQVFFTDVFVPDDYLVGKRGRGFQYISEALDLERFTMFTLSPIADRTRVLIDYVKEATRDGEPLRKDPNVRRLIAHIATDTAVAKALSTRFVCAAKTVGAKPPTVQSSQYKLFMNETGQRLANAALDEVRRRVQNETLGHRGRKEDPLYRIRRLLLVAHERLSERGWERVEEGLRRGDPDGSVGAAYLAKELLREVYATRGPKTARRRLLRFYRHCRDSALPELARLARTIRSWEREILAWHDTGLTNAATEGNNLLIKKVKRVGHGFRNFENYRLRLLLHCGVEWHTPPVARIRGRQPRLVA